jgi:hypothetical protein
MKEPSHIELYNIVLVQHNHGLGAIASRCLLSCFGIDASDVFNFGDQDHFAL